MTVGHAMHDSCLVVLLLTNHYNIMHTHLNMCSPGPAVGNIPEMSSSEFLPRLKKIDCNRDGKFYVVVTSPPEKVTAY